MIIKYVAKDWQGGPCTFRPEQNEFGSSHCPRPMLDSGTNPISHCVTGPGLFQYSI